MGRAKDAGLSFAGHSRVKGSTERRYGGCRGDIKVVDVRSWDCVMDAYIGYVQYLYINLLQKMDRQDFV